MAFNPNSRLGLAGDLAGIKKQEDSVSPGVAENTGTGNNFSSDYVFEQYKITDEDMGPDGVVDFDKIASAPQVPDEIGGNELFQMTGNVSTGDIIPVPVGDNRFDEIVGGQDTSENVREMEPRDITGREMVETAGQSDVPGEVSMTGPESEMIKQQREQQRKDESESRVTFEGTELEKENDPFGLDTALVPLSDEDKRLMFQKQEGEEEKTTLENIASGLAKFIGIVLAPESYLTMRKQNQKARLKREQMKNEKEMFNKKLKFGMDKLNKRLKAKRDRAKKQYERELEKISIEQKNQLRMLKNSQDFKEYMSEKEQQQAVEKIEQKFENRKNILSKEHENNKEEIKLRSNEKRKLWDDKISWKEKKESLRLTHKRNKEYRKNLQEAMSNAGEKLTVDMSERERKDIAIRQLQNVLGKTELSDKDMEHVPMIANQEVEKMTALDKLGNMTNVANSLVAVTTASDISPVERTRKYAEILGDLPKDQQKKIQSMLPTTDIDAIDVSRVNKALEEESAVKAKAALRMKDQLTELAGKGYFGEDYKKNPNKLITTLQDIASEDTGEMSSEDALKAGKEWIKFTDEVTTFAVGKAINFFEETDKVEITDNWIFSNDFYTQLKENLSEEYTTQGRINDRYEQDITNRIDKATVGRVARNAVAGGRNQDDVEVAVSDYIEAQAMSEIAQDAEIGKEVDGKINRIYATPELDPTEAINRFSEMNFLGEKVNLSKSNSNVLLQQVSNLSRLVKNNPAIYNSTDSKYMLRRKVMGWVEASDVVNQFAARTSKPVGPGIINIVKANTAQKLQEYIYNRPNKLRDEQIIVDIVANQFDSIKPQE